MNYIIIFFIKFYQFFISPWLGKNCRFLPTCSQYSCEVIKIHGTMKGVVLSIKRILKCHPFAKADYDPPPPKQK